MLQSTTSHWLRGPTLFPQATWGAACLAGVLVLALPGCGGGGSGSGPGSGFGLVESNVNTNQVWRINRAMTFRFTQPIDISTVNLNTVSVAEVGGAPAAGTFSLLDAYTLEFQPTCPTAPDYSDAGLQPGGRRYLVDLVSSATSSGATVRSLSGAPLSVGLTAEILTPDSDDLAVLFDDVQVGPPAALLWDGTGSVPQTGGFSYVEEGGSADTRYVFRPRPVAVAALGAEVAVDDYTAPLNLYSVSSSALSVVLELDQPVDPSAANISPDRVRLEYCSRLDGNCGSDASEWIDVAHTVTLEANCAGGGSRVRVTPIGILPLGRVVRVSLAASFRDLVGNGNLLDVPIASFLVDDGIPDGGTVPDPLGDEILEPFTLGGSGTGSTEDPFALLDAPSAVWADDGKLTAGFEFGGTGGPGGDFDWTVSALPGGSATILNTAFSTIQNTTLTATQTIVNGQVDVRNLTIDQGGVLEIRGPFPCVIRASGTVTINGKLLIRGVSSRGLSSFNATNLPDLGALGNGGGGRGGTGNPLTSQSSPAGESGFGAFEAPGGGGGGGESGYNGNGVVNDRRGGGGGGGSLGDRMVLFLSGTANPNGCPDQRIIGLDSEEGNRGGVNANGALSGAPRPRGGTQGPRPFLDTNPDNDFFGLMRMGSTIVRGELDRAWAGAGGGGGGNAITSNTFPNPNWTNTGDERGAGAGGGGGSLTILCLGDIVFGANGRIDAGGGTGGGGENTSGINRVGAGSGGGSGGHVILQVGGQIDFRLVRTNQSAERDRGGIWARGGQGGGGPFSAGGTAPNSVETTPTADRLPRDHYTVAQGGLVDPPPCAVAATGNTAGNGLYDGAGGDGGPGIIQLHAASLADILPPTTGGETLTACLKPNPVGSTIRFGPLSSDSTSNVNTPTQWNQLLPSFGRISKAQSRWIPLGATSVSPISNTAEPTEFVFGGVDANGQVQKSGSGDSATQLELPSILTGTGSQVVTTSPSLPYITDDKRTVVFDGTTVADDIYLRNPSLLRFFAVRFEVGANVSNFEAASATYDETSGLLRVTVATSGMPLGTIPTNGSASVSVRPRFFRVQTAGTPDLLPDPVSIGFEFQATSATALGLPDEGAATAWTPDIADLNTDPDNPDLRFFRFRVTFDLGTSTLTATTPVPSIEFLRIPFRF